MKTKLLIFTLLFLSPVIVPDTSEGIVAQQEATVLICTGKYSKRYHNSMCRGMKACKGDRKKVSLSEAKRLGLTACGYCY